MRINKTAGILLVLVALMLGGLGGGVLLTQQVLSVDAAPLLQEGATDDDDGANEDDDANEADEVEEAVSPDQATISAADAKAAAEAAYPEAKAVAVELEHERGQVVYEVELDNGLEVQIDATNGDFLGLDD